MITFFHQYSWFCINTVCLSIWQCWRYS